MNSEEELQQNDQSSVFDQLASTDGWQTTLVSTDTEDALSFSLHVNEKVIVSKPIFKISTSVEEFPGLETLIAKSKGKLKLTCFLLDAIAMYLNAGGELDEIESLISDLRWIEPYTLDYKDWFVINAGYVYTVGQVQPFLEFQNSKDAGDNMCWVKDIYIDFGLVDD